MFEALSAALLFIINTVFDIYIFILIIRLVLAFVRADYSHPVTQFIVKLTSFLVNPLRKYIPNTWKIEWATVVLILVLEFIKFFVISTYSFGIPNFLGLVVLSFADAFKLLLLTFFYAILLQAILSLIQPRLAINRLLEQFTSPILKPLQRIIPTISGIDITPIPALIILMVLLIFVTQFLKMGVTMATGV